MGLIDSIQCRRQPIRNNQQWKQMKCLVTGKTAGRPVIIGFVLSQHSPLQLVQKKLMTPRGAVLSRAGKIIIPYFCSSGRYSIISP